LIQVTEKVWENVEDDGTCVEEVEKKLPKEEKISNDTKKPAKVS
jgi:hypothetical protein